MSSWKETHETGIDFIDRQHQEIVKDLENIQMQITRERSRTAVMEAIEELEMACSRHFTEEDNLMVRYNYPATEAHIREHDIFSARIRKLKTFCAAGNLEKITIELNDMEAWFFRHIIDYDRRYMEHIYA